jgi:ligand-binding sensor domain-containing protein/two-component sensor histidine kinase
MVGHRVTAKTMTKPSRKRGGVGHWLLAGILLVAFGMGLGPARSSAQVTRPRSAGIPPTLSIYQLRHTAWLAADGAPLWPGDITEDSHGLLWLSASSGLSRFDGMTFDHSLGKIINGKAIKTVFADPAGNLWVGYLLGGVGRLRDGHLTDYPPGQGLPTGTAFTFATAADGTLWVAGTDGVSHLVGDTWQRASAKDGYDGRPLNELTKTHDGSIWISGAKDYLVLRPHASRFINVARETGKKELEASPDTPSMRYEPEYAITMRDSAGSIWSGTSEGLTRTRAIPDGSGGTKQITESFTAADGLSDNAVSLLFESREGNIWVATAGGLDRFRQNKATPVVFHRIVLKPAIAVDPDNVAWIGSIWGAWRTTSMDSANPVAVPSLGKLISCIAVDRTGAVWTAGQNGVQRTFGGKSESIPLPQDLADSAYRFQALAVDNAGVLWLSAAGHGLYAHINGAWVRDGGLRGLPDDLATRVVFDGMGRQWIAYSEGNLVRIDHGKQQVFDERSGLKVGAPVALWSERDQVWVAGNKGIAHMVGDRFVTLVPASEGLFDGVTGVVMRPNGDLWVHGTQGLMHVRAKELEAVGRDPSHPVTVDVYDQHDGVSGTTDKLRPVPSLVAASDGRLWVATGTGVSWLDPEDVPRNAVPPIPVIDAVTVDGQKYPGHGTLKLPENSRNIRVDFTAGSLTVPELVGFEHRLDGVDPSWQMVHGRHYVEYSNLRHGTYQFHLHVSNEDGVPGLNEATVTLVIPPRFFATWWFITLSVIVGLLLIWLLYIRHVRRLLGLLRATTLERERIARELHDTLLQSVQGLLLLIQAIARASNESNTRERLLGAANAARATVIEGRGRVQSLRMTVADVDLPAQLSEAAAQLVAMYPAEFSLNISGTRVPLNPAIAHELLPVLREMLTNAFRHAKATHIELHLRYGVTSFQGTVTDNGTGLAPEVLKTGVRAGHWGLTGMRERVAQLHGRFHVDSATGQGTLVSVSVPAQRLYRDNVIVRLLRRWRRPGAST